MEQSSIKIRAVEIIKRDHFVIEQHLREFETIKKCKVINYSNLIHTWKGFCKLLSEHETRERKLLELLAKWKFKIPHKKISFEHGEFKKHRDSIIKAIKSGSEFEIRRSLNTDFQVLKVKIRKHIEYEDEIFYTLPLEEMDKQAITELQSIQI